VIVIRRPKSSPGKLGRNPTRYNTVGCLALTMFWAAGAAAQGRSIPLPNDIPPFEFPLASSRTAGMVGRVFYASRGESGFGAEMEAEAGLGEIWPILAVHRGKVPLTLHFGAEVYGRFSLGDASSALISNDWQVNVILTADFKRLRLAAEAYHESSHLGDEYRDRFPGPRVNWSREIVGLWASYRAGLLKLHANASYAAIDAINVGRGAFSAAVDYRGKPGGMLGGSAGTIWAVNAEAQEFTNWKVTWSGRAGARFADPAGRRGFALLLTFLDGYSPQRQFFLQKARYYGVEVRFDL
jgi:hypothetical protein